MKQAYLFETDNFGFGPLKESDLDYLLMLDTDDDTMRFFPGGARTQQEVEANLKKYIRVYDEKGYGLFLVFDIASDEFISGYNKIGFNFESVSKTNKI